MTAVVQTTPAGDALADMLDSLKIRGRLYCRAHLSSPWALAFAASHFAHFHIVDRGRCCLRVAGAADHVQLERGDFLFVSRGVRYQLSDAPSTRAIPIERLVGDSQGGLKAVITHGGTGLDGEPHGATDGGTDEAAAMTCGSFEFLGASAETVLGALPPWIRVETMRGPMAEWFAQTLGLLQAELREPGVGSDAIVARLIDVLFVRALRAWVDAQPAGAAGWLAAWRDPAIGAALGLLHRDLETPWTVRTLAAAVGMSRSPFAARFTKLVGVSPLAYRQRWRLQIAAAQLREGPIDLASLAERVGYESAAAFSRAFKREFGVSPGAFRRGTNRSSAAD